MLDQLWTASGRRCIVGIKGKKVHHCWFDDNESAWKKAVELDAAGWNVYYSPSLFDPDGVDRRQAETNPRTGRPYTGREQDTVATIPALWLDLDCGADKDYANQAEAAQALKDWVDTTGVAYPSHVVSSGYGLHVYWLLDAPQTHAQWLPVAQHLKQACRVHGLAADATRTADAASLLRVPGTHNTKRSPQVDVKVLVERDTRTNLQQFRARLPMVGPQGSVPSSTPAGEWDTTIKHPPGDANKIADRCQQMGQIRFHKGGVEEPLWRAGLSIIARCKDGETLIHDWSKGDERYDPDQTEDKAANTKGPATCRHFADINPSACEGCPHAGKVNSPISLAYAEELPETEAGEETLRVPGYTVTNEGIFKEPLSDEGGPLTKIADFPIWIEDAREHASPTEAQLRSELLIGWEDVRGRRYTVPITQAELHDSRSWTAWLANNNLASFVQGPPMAQYISKMNKARYRKEGSRIIYDSLGWYNGHKLFVIGSQGVTPDGIKEVLVDSKDAIAALAPRGSLEQWMAGMKILGNPQFKAQAFGLLLGFAAPLLDIVNKKGAVVTFAGQSGYGKTMSAQAALSIFADPDKTMETAGSTHNALGMYLARHRHVPGLVDEVTHMSDKRLRDLIYMAANGQDKSALTQRRERRVAATWRTVSILTSNHSIVDRHQKDIEEAHRRRLVEVHFMNRVSKRVGESINETIQLNHGVAAPPFLQLVMKHHDQIPALFKVCERQVEQWGFANPADRFGSWTCAAALLGGLLARIAGVLPFDPLPVVQEITRQASAANEDILTPEMQARSALFEFLTTHSKRICVWAEGKPLAQDDTDDPVARISGNDLFVRATELNSHWDEHKIFRRGLKDWLQTVAPRGKRSLRLAPGTPPVYVYIFRMDELGWAMGDIKDAE